MALGRWQATIVDTEGNILPGAQVTVRRETAGAPLAVIYSDRDGIAILGNPFTVGVDGLAAFHVAGGAYRVTATYGAFTQDWRYVAIGTAAEGDLLPLDISYTFSDSTGDADPGAGVLRFNNASAALTTQIYIDDVDDLGADVSVWVARIDDYGITSDRGVLIVRSVAGTAEAVFQVTGSVTDGGTYSKVAVTSLGTIGTFTTSERVTVNFVPRGVDGADGDVVGPGFATVGQIAEFSATDGTSIRGATVAEGSPTDPLVAGTVAGVQAAVPGHLIDAGHLRTAAVAEALSDAAVVVVNWAAAINFTLTVTANRQIGNPSNGIPGTWRTILVQGNDATDRTITFASNYLGEVPTITDCDSTRWYLLMIYCVAANHFVVSSKKAKGT
jgi:hypothetical protein